jgi:glycosyltransferase involved in cell wall biosynthesis
MILAPARERLTRASALDADLTIVILTRDEEALIERCIRTVPDRYPVVVVDAESCDGTREIARAAGAKVLVNAWTDIRTQRNFALEQCAIDTTWILFVDADETFPGEVFAWFDRYGRHATDFDVGMIPSYLVHKGRTLRYAPGYPIYHARLWRRCSTKFVYDHLGSGTAPDDARVKYLQVHYLHDFLACGILPWLRKHLGYAERQLHHERRLGSIGDAAGRPALTRRSRLSRRWARSFWRVPGRFLYHYILRGGFRDGRAGFEFAIIYAWYEATKWVMRNVAPDPRERG